MRYTVLLFCRSLSQTPFKEKFAHFKTFELPSSACFQNQIEKVDSGFVVQNLFVIYIFNFHLCGGSFNAHPIPLPLAFTFREQSNLGERQKETSPQMFIQNLTQSQKPLNTVLRVISEVKGNLSLSLPFKKCGRNLGYWLSTQSLLFSFPCKGYHFEDSHCLGALCWKGGLSERTATFDFDGPFREVSSESVVDQFW